VNAARLYSMVMGIGIRYTIRMMGGSWIPPDTQPVIDRNIRRRQMLADARDFMIIMWIVMQGFGWFHPDSYGMFQAQVEEAYLEHAERLGYWEE
jgi:hypothetical protein